MARQVVVASLLALILPIDVVSGQESITLTLNGGNLDYESSSEITGFQFNHDDCATTASGGAAGDAQYMVSASTSVVIGFSMTGATIQAGSGTLLENVDCDTISGLVFDGFDTATLAAGCTDVTYNLGGGSFASEMSFTINGETYTAGEGTVCLVDGCYAVGLTDSWGDGWNGGTLTLGDHLFGMASGSTGVGQIGVNDADCVVSGVQISGCMDADATNYNADANHDDDTCEYDCDAYVVDTALYTCYWYIWESGYGYSFETVNGWSSKNCACVEEPVNGCTDETACNYNADATLDDGCEYISCGALTCEEFLDTDTQYTCYWYVWLYPTPGTYSVDTITGWGTKDCTCVEEPVTGCTDEAACNYNADATLDDGGCDISCSCEDQVIECGGGSWGSEVSWSISDCDGNELASGNGSYSPACIDLPANYSVTMGDTFGDGWNGNVLTIGDWSDAGPDSGCDSDNGCFKTVMIGSCAGTTGCTDSSACNFSAFADIDDGSCTLAADNFDCDGNCTTDVDCAGVCAGSSVEDACGDCDGDGSLCAGCIDVAYNLVCGSFCNEMSFTINGQTYTAGEGTVCLVDGCYALTLTDSWGDGWNGGLLTLGDHLFGMASGSTADGQIGMNDADCVVEGNLISGCMDAGASNYNADANHDDDSCEYNCETLLECNGGSFQNEVSWSISDCDGNEVASGTASDSPVCVDLPDNYSVTMGDTWGDGWNGNVLTIGDWSDVGPDSGCESEPEDGDGHEICFKTEYVGSCEGAAANGDPHLKNIKGESFDVMQTGNMLLLEVPRGSRVETLEFAVHGDIERLGLVECGPTFITKVVMAGRWLEFPVSIRAGKSTHKPFGIQLNEGGWKAHADFEKTTNGRMSVIKRDRAFLMKVDVLDIAVSMPNRPRAFLDLQIKGIGKITAQVGGLLGLDDHTAAESLPSECNSPKRRRLSVLRAEVGEEWSASAAL